MLESTLMLTMAVKGVFADPRGAARRYASAAKSAATSPSSDTCVDDAGCGVVNPAKCA
jgi:hypothetical protein